MRIIIKAKNLVLSEGFKNFIEKKISVFKKFISVLKEDYPESQKTLAEVLVEVEKETMHHKKGEIFKSSVEISLPGKKLMSQARGDDLERVIINVKEQMKKEINKYKFKKIDKIRRGQRKLKEKLN